MGLGEMWHTNETGLRLGGVGAPGPVFSLWHSYSFQRVTRPARNKMLPELYVLTEDVVQKALPIRTIVF